VKALVTGGAGFIGSNIVALLLGDGHEVVVLDNLSSGHRTNLDAVPSVRIVEADVRDRAALDAAMRGVEVVFHLAASVGNARSIANPIEDSSVNLMGTLEVLEAGRRHGIRKIVFSSSAGIFGELKQLPIREDHPVEPDSPYGASKLAAEKMCLAYAKLFGIEAVCLRYFNVYGRHQRFDAYGNVIPIFAQRLFTDQALTIYGDGEQTRDFVNVADVAQANYRAGLARDLSGAFNVGSGASITINELAAMMVALSGRGVPIVHAAPRPGDVRHSRADVSAALAAFGFRPAVELRVGLEAYLAWFKEQAAV
jgi:UDP-glucose 4-epimerase